MESLEQKSDLFMSENQEQIEDNGILYRIVDGMMRIRKTIRDSQPTWYMEWEL